MSLSQADKGRAFQALHEGEPFVIPNPWDAGSAKALAALGFKALASTSGGFAHTLGKVDGEVTLGEAAGHAQVLSEATDLPVSMDLENGYGPEPGDAVWAVQRVADAGAVGASIEDWDPDGHLYGIEHATARVAAAADAARELEFPFTLTARAENHFRGVDDLDDTIARLKAYEEAGADVLYAPGLRDYDQIRAVSSALERPVNVLAYPGLTLAELAGAGVQRVSIGSWFSHIATTSAMSAAESIRDSGDFSVLKV